MLRRTWDRLVHKQGLILYPLSLGIINTIAFFAVYSAGGNQLTATGFFTANFDRWGYIKEHFISSFAWTPALAVAIFAGIAVCIFSAMIRAPYFRAIVANGYPLAPRHAGEALHLTLLYLFTNAIVWLLPQALPTAGILSELVLLAVYAVAIVLVFADYIIVYEQSSVFQAMRRSLQLVGRRWATVILIFLVVQLVSYGLFRLYDSYYAQAERIFFLLPLSQLLVEAFIVLVVDVVLVFLYQQLRRS